MQAAFHTPVADSDAVQAQSQGDNDVDVSDERTEIFTAYKCSLPEDVGVPHPGSVVEAACLQAVALPSATYPLLEAMNPEQVSTGLISRLQLESALYACQRHLTFAADGSRHGILFPIASSSLLRNCYIRPDGLMVDHSDSSLPRAL